MTLNEKEIRAMLEKIVAQNKNKEINISISANETGSTRFANNGITTNGVYNQMNVFVEVRQGKKKGIALINELNGDKIQEAIDRADAMARITPANEELMPQLGPQTYTTVPAMTYAQTAAFAPNQRVDAVIEVVKRAKKNNLSAAGFFETSSGITGSLNSFGLYNFYDYSRAYFSTTMRAEGGSGWAALDDENVDKLSPVALAEAAIKKALSSRQPKTKQPGKYTVVLEPAAVADIVWYLMYNLAAREADEGRSFFSKAQGQNKLGEKLFSPLVSIYSDPANPELPAFPVGEDGLPVGKLDVVQEGVLKNLSYSRFWADKMHTQPVPFPGNAIMKGGNNRLEDLIRATQQGVLISRFHYIRDLNPMEMLLTGMTRDGVYWIENGKVQYPIKNFRFNESPVNVLKNVMALGKPVRAIGGDTSQSALVPPMQVKDFNLASLSDAV